VLTKVNGATNAKNPVKKKSGLASKRKLKPKQKAVNGTGKAEEGVCSW